MWRAPGLPPVMHCPPREHILELTAPFPKEKACRVLGSFSAASFHSSPHKDERREGVKVALTAKTEWGWGVSNVTNTLRTKRPVSWAQVESLHHLPPGHPCQPHLPRRSQPLLCQRTSRCLRSLCLGFRFYHARCHFGVPGTRLTWDSPAVLGARLAL